MRISRLAAAAIIFCGICTYTPTKAANTYLVASITPLRLEPRSNVSSSQVVIRPLTTTHNMQVLTSNDIAFYRQAFGAQENNDWATADRALAAIKDRELEGHVLADRFDRRPVTAVELRNWLLKYSDLPEATVIHARLRALRGVEATHLSVLPAPPNVSDSWSGGNGSYGASDGFKANDGQKLSRHAQLLAARMTNAIRRDRAEQAEKFLKSEQVKLNLSPADVAELQGRLAAGYFYDGKFDDAWRFARSAAQAGNPLGLWINGLCAWQQHNGQVAAVSFARLAVTPGLSSWDHAAAAYWAYRANKLTNNGAQANYWLRQAASRPHSFYGLMAANLLAHDIIWSWEVPKLTGSSMGLILNQPAGRRAMALLEVGQTALAESELRHLNPNRQHNMMEAMLALADKNNMANLSVQLAGLSSNDKAGRVYDAALYPVPSWKPDQGFQIDRALIYALIRHESGFNPAAVSGAGACGLMQLMPATASLLANDNQSTQKCAGRLVQPSYNMGLGQKYLKLLSDQPAIGDNLVLLLTAYNSGPAKISQWTNNGAQNDPLFFIESLPVRETRTYVQQVMIHYWSYRARLKQPQVALARLARGEWPRYALTDDTKPVKVQHAKASSRIEVASE